MDIKKKKNRLEEIDMESQVKWSKIQRQLKEFHIFRTVECVDYKLLKYWFSVNERTMQRDIKDLTDAGLISVTYSQHPYKKGYISDGKTPYMHEEENRNRRMHLRKLNRIGTLMQKLYDPYEGFADLRDECRQVKDTVKAQYTALFPDLCEKTMRRDFRLMCEIDYFVEYDAECFGYRVTFPDMY